MPNNHRCPTTLRSYAVLCEDLFSPAVAESASCETVFVGVKLMPFCARLPTDVAYHTVRLL